MSEEDSLSQELKTLMTDLTTLGDEVRLKVHLGSMDAKDTWAKLEPRLQQLQERAATATSSVKQELKDSAQELKAEVHDLKTLLGL
jgi:hypothetical protein